MAEVADLSLKPSLNVPDVCKGNFPEGADDDRAVVTLHVSVLSNGKVASANVVREMPTGQGFGLAATRCLSAQIFDSALNKTGEAVAGVTTVNVRFAR